MRKLVMAAFFFSGFSGLVLENVWVHSLILIFGGTTLAIVTVLTAFMAGLAFGSYLGGRWSHLVDRPVRVYGILEAGVALYALLLPVLLQALPYVLQWMPDDSTFLTRAFVRFVFCLVLLLFPTTLMGATLPILSRYIGQEEHSLGFNVGLLYSMNTFGAVVGAMIGGFVLLPFLGHSGTLFTVVTGLLALAGTLIFIGGPVVKSASAETAEASSLEESDSSEEASQEKSEEASAETSTSELTDKWRHRTVLFCIALTGGLAMSCQVLWSRALSMIIGSSTYAFTLILSTFLIGLAGGSTWGAWYTRKKVNLLHAWIYLLVLTAALIAGGIWVLDLLPLLFAYMVKTFGIFDYADPLLFFSIKASIAAIPILLPTLCMGAFFPIVLAIYDKKGDAVGLRVGKLYAANTLGSILGSGIAGFVLIPRYGIQSGLGICVCMYLLCAFGLLFFATRTHRIWIATLLTGCLLLLIQAPEWNQTRMSLGYFRLSTILRQEQSPPKYKTLYYKEGISTTVAIQTLGRDQIFLRVNGKIDASSHADQSTQVGMSVLPFLFHPGQPKDVLVIGWGSGMTVGSALQFPVKKLTAIELEPAVLEAARYFGPWNFRPRLDPRLHIVYNDGRNFLSGTKQKYDVLISAPSNPWMSGVSNLFTVEYFEQVSQHLRDDGIFCQWMQAYELSEVHFFSFMASVRKKFPHIALFEPARGDTLLLASKRPINRDIGKLRKRLGMPTFRMLAKKMHIFDEQGLMLRFLLESKSIDKLIKEKKAIPNTDDHNVLGYFAPFDILRATQSSFQSHLHKTFSTRGHDFQNFFTIDGKPMGYDRFPKRWFGMFILMLTRGYIDKAEELFAKVAKAQPKAAFLPRIRKLIRMMQLKEKPPKYTERAASRPSSLPSSASAARYTAKWQKEIHRFYQKDPKKACLKHILPLTKRRGFEQGLPPNLFFFLGSCFARYQKWPDAAYLFNQYLKKTQNRTR